MGFGSEAGVLAGNIIVALLALGSLTRVLQMVGTFGDPQEGRWRASALCHLALVAALFVSFAVSAYYGSARAAMPFLWENWVALAAMRLISIFPGALVAAAWWTWRGMPVRKVTMFAVGEAIAVLVLWIVLVRVLA